MHVTLPQIMSWCALDPSCVTGTTQVIGIDSGKVSGSPLRSQNIPHNCTQPDMAIL